MNIEYLYKHNFIAFFDVQGEILMNFLCTLSVVHYEYFSNIKINSVHGKILK